VITPALTRRWDRRGAAPAIKRCRPCSLPPCALVLHGQRPGELPSPSQLRPCATHKPSHDPLGKLLVPCRPSRTSAAPHHGSRQPPPPVAGAPTRRPPPRPGGAPESNPWGWGPFPHPFPAASAGELAGFRRAAPATTPGDHLARSNIFPRSYLRTKGICVSSKIFPGVWPKFLISNSKVILLKLLKFIENSRKIIEMQT
jgi:hypothetical protein